MGWLVDNVWLVFQRMDLEGSGNRPLERRPSSKASDFGGGAFYQVDNGRYRSYETVAMLLFEDLGSIAHRLGTSRFEICGVNERLSIIAGRER